MKQRSENYGTKNEDHLRKYRNREEPYLPWQTDDSDLPERVMTPEQSKAFAENVAKLMRRK
jgi:hypothetical protein